VASAIFTATPDLTAAFPAQAAREMGWHNVALLDAQEIPRAGQPGKVQSGFSSTGIRRKARPRFGTSISEEPEPCGQIGRCK